VKLTTMRLTALGAVAALALAACGSSSQPVPGQNAAPANTAASGQKVTLTIESWRSDDQTFWDDKIIPAFEKTHPNIKLAFKPTAPTQYNAALGSKLQSGTAGDLVTCRPYDASLKLYDKGYLAAVDDVNGMANFSAAAKSAWQTDDGKTTYCVPMASVIHGFYYNKDAFSQAGVSAPTTIAEFHDVLAKLKAAGKYTPIAQGTKDQWDIAEVDYTGLGPNYWQGEQGRQAIITGTAKLTDPQFVQPLAELKSWAPYMPSGYQSIGYSDAQVLFTSGKGAIFPGGSWEIPGFEKDATFPIGVFKPPVPTSGAPCFISDQNDHAMGLNKSSAHPAEAKIFLEWVASPAFASVYSNTLPGFFSLQSNSVAIKDPLASQFVSWRNDCKSTIRLPLQFLNRGTPDLLDQIYDGASQVVNGTETPQQAATKFQQGLDSWYKPRAAA
jgi:raffinose/stachyose/melibiose transport system substrate-binding protein